MKKLMVVVLAACSLIALGAGQPGHPAVMAAMNQHVAEKIGLSPEIQKQIRQIEQDSRKAIKDLQQKTKAAMEKQAKLMAEAKPDEGAVMAAINELFDLRKEMAKVQTKRILAVKSLLTPEQLEQALVEMKKKHEEQRAKKGKEPKGARHGCDKAKTAPAPAQAK